MKYLNFFLAVFFLACGCQNQEEDEFDPTTLVEDEFDTSHLAGDPIPSPQEIMVKESALVE